MKFHYYLDKKENKKKEHQVRITVAMRGVRMVGTIGYNVPMSMWDAKRKQFKKGVANSDGVDSDIIKSRLSDIESHFNNLELRTTDKFTMEQLRAELAKAIAKNQAKLAAINDGASEEVIEKKEAEAEKKERKPKVKPAAEYMDEFIREESRLKEWSLETLKMVKSFKNHLLKFKKTAGLDFYDKNGLDKFITYLRSDCGLEENSVQKQYKNLTWFLRWAIRKGYTQIRDVESYEPVFKTVKKPVIFLTKEELDKLYKLESPASGTVLKLKT
ncbi:MAG: phage integrase SAM-like domain-containing protein, partial [Bacteroidales bacterium]|nr:phage integrase SAM-like domain-containing protein [Bacteroidales bacterium]